MRLVIAALGGMAAAACGSPRYDPVADIPHAEYATTGDAMRAILAHNRDADVYAVGEYHPTSGTIVARHSPLARFTNEIIELLGPRANHLVVEAWFDASCVVADPVQTQIQAATSRPPSQHAELASLVARTGRLQMQTHGLPMTCIEHASVLDPRGRVDFWRLLVMVTDKLSTTTRALVAGGRRVIVYGGALHNDLYPRWPLEQLSYAHGLAREASVIELDLVVPEIVAPLRSIRQERWFPLLGRAAPGRVLVWERGPGSYVLILPAQSEAVAKVARADDVM